MPLSSRHWSRGRCDQHRPLLRLGIGSGRGAPKGGDQVVHWIPGNRGSWGIFKPARTVGKGRSCEVQAWFSSECDSSITDCKQLQLVVANKYRIAEVRREAEER